MDNQSEQECVFYRVRTVEEHLEGAGLDRKSYNTAVVLLAAAVLGPDVNHIAEELGLEEAFVQRIANRMTSSGLWSMDGVYTEDWVYEPFFDGFFEQLAVAAGLAIAVPSADGFAYIPARERSSSVM